LFDSLEKTLTVQRSKELKRIPRRQTFSIFPEKEMYDGRVLYLFSL
jgi:hypothetical protein